MPRWPTSASPRRAVAGRAAATGTCRAGEPPRSGRRSGGRRSRRRRPRCRRTARGCVTSTAATVRPATQRSRPSRTVSTSGSSGTGSAQPVASARAAASRAESARHAVSAAACSASFLLRPVQAANSSPATWRRAVKVFSWSGPAGGHDVLGHAEPVLGGELLQAGLPVEAGAARGDVLEQAVEQAVDDPGGLVQAAVEVDRAEHRLEGVGEDAEPCRGRRCPPRRGRAAGRRRGRPGRSSRATSASARMLTTEARSLASLPSARSGWRGTACR